MGTTAHITIVHMSDGSESILCDSYFYLGTVSALLVDVDFGEFQSTIAFQPGKSLRLTITIPTTSTNTQVALFIELISVSQTISVQSQVLFLVKALGKYFIQPYIGIKLFEAIQEMARAPPYCLL